MRANKFVVGSFAVALASATLAACSFGPDAYKGPFPGAPVDAAPSTPTPDAATGNVDAAVDSKSDGGSDGGTTGDAGSDGQVDGVDSGGADASGADSAGDATAG